MNRIDIFIDPTIFQQTYADFGFESIPIGQLPERTCAYIIRRGDSGYGTVLHLVEFTGDYSPWSNHALFKYVDRGQPQDELWLTGHEILLMKSPNRRHLCSVDGHVATDMGGVKAYCKYCDVDMWFDRKTALFSIYDPFEPKR